MKVLIAEDNPSARLLLVKIMKNSGYTVLEAEDGIKAWEILKNETIDILITDWIMPNMDGISLCRKIRSSSRYYETYVYIIVITSRDEKEDLIKVFESGADDYIAKPLDRAELLARIKTAGRIIELEKRHVRDKTALLKHSDDLDKKIKELNCLYLISDLVNAAGISVDEILEKTVDLIHSTLYSPDINHVRIITDDRVYQTENFTLTEWKLDHDILVQGERFGTLEVHLRENNSESAPDFLREDGDKRIIKTVTERLGSAIEKKKIEEKLKEDERKYRTILENIEEGYFEVDTAGTFTFVNDSMSNILGYSKDELTGMNHRQITSKEQSRGAYKIFNNVFKTEKPKLSHSQELIRRDGAVKYVEMSVSLIKNALGEKKGFRGIIRDITERKEYEENLKFFKDLIDQSNDAISVLDQVSGKFIYVNQKACETYCYERDDLLRMEPKDLDDSLNNDRKKAMIEELKQKKSLLFETVNKRKDGTPIPLEISIKTIYQGSNPYHLIVARDISDRKKAQRDREEYEAQLIQSEKMASVGQLAAGVAHEINNPTGFVSSNLKTLGEYQHDMCLLIDEYRGCLSNIRAGWSERNPFPGVEQHNRILEMEKKLDIEYILNDINDLILESQSGTERIKKIVNDLKNFAHPGEDRMKYTNINENLESTLNVVWNELKYKAELIRDFGNLPLIECYPQQLNQVFGNILVNAAQAIEKHGKITITTKALEDHVEISITDNGSGIPEENISRIFDPFFTTKEVGKGTGLGLNVAYNIIKKHSGTIDVRSKPGEGTTFRIVLPSSMLIHKDVKQE